MPANVTLALTGAQYGSLRKFLFPGDGKEAVALLLCGRREGDRRHRLVVKDIFEIPYAVCSERTAVSITWPPEYIASVLDRAALENLSVIKVHSHPNGYAAFSTTDNEGDSRLLPMINGYVEAQIYHGSAVMLPDGQMFGRVWSKDEGFKDIWSIQVAGDDLLFWYADKGSKVNPSFLASHAQAFDEGTIESLQRISAFVAGASGTGSPTVEQLVRLGVGEIVIADDDYIEDRNLNRILNSTMADAAAKRSKVGVLKRAIKRIGLGTRVIPLRKNLWDPDVIRIAAQCDVAFGSMDTVDGRYLLNRLSTYYNIPYFDVGIKLDTFREGDRKGTIREACGTVHYIQPGGSSLMSRGLFTMEAVAAAGLLRSDPAAHAQQLKDGYISGFQGRRPAVISINMLASSLMVNEFLARLHPYREQPNEKHSSVTFSLASCELMKEAEEPPCAILSDYVGTGDVKPLLGLLELSDKKRKRK